MNTKVEQIITELISALSNLVAADNCNYTVEGMRHAGYFDDARKALANAGHPCEPYRVPKDDEQRVKEAE